MGVAGGNKALDLLKNNGTTAQAQCSPVQVVERPMMWFTSDCANGYTLTTCIPFVQTVLHSTV